MQVQRMTLAYLSEVFRIAFPLLHKYLYIRLYIFHPHHRMQSSRNHLFLKIQVALRLQFHNTYPLYQHILLHPFHSY